ncbi:MAG TPA: alpha/beta hydrolase [Anaerolineales bacterium]|nr:alpha/beta hydrolase [Anaerolineales bacterium]
MTVLIAILLLIIGLLVYLFAFGPKLTQEADEIIERALTGPLPNIVSGQTGFAYSDGLKVWYERIFPPGPSKGTVLLISAVGGNALEWFPSVVRQFIDAGYQVVRYDHRGTGLSDWMPNWSLRRPYSIADMARDALAILDALKVEKVHIVGLSMGGMIAQEVAIQQPARVQSLTLMMTSGFIGDPELPGLTSRYFVNSILKGIPLLKYRLLSGEKNLVKERIAKQLSFPGYEGLDIKETAEVVLYDLRKRKGLNLRAVLQHQTAVQVAGSRYDKLKTLAIPTLVIHGTADALIPFEHGRKLAEIIPNAESLWLAGVGHMFPVPDMDALMKAILSHLDQHPSADSVPAGHQGTLLP